MCKWEPRHGLRPLGVICVVLPLLVTACGGTDRNDGTSKNDNGAADSGETSSSTSASGGSAGEATQTSASVSSDTATGSGGMGVGGSAGADAGETTDSTGGTSTSGVGGSDSTTGTVEPGEVNSLPLAGGDTEKLDLLFVIDNSISMADKQELFRTGVPTLVERLINPVCVSLTDPAQTALVENPTLACPNGFEREFEPLSDVHVGLISSSLGGHGGEICSPNSPGSFDETQNDRSRLLPSVREGLSSYEDLGFLAWDPQGTKSPPGESDVVTFVAGFQDQVVAAGEVGCGYEAPLEAWYRFLVEPSPPLDMFNDGARAYPVTDADGNIIVDDIVLAQRAAFLRPDSVVAIVMLTDENDCSVIDGQLGWLASTVLVGASSFNMPSATEACETDPNSPCCRSCGLNEAAPPDGCVARDVDPGCVPRDPSTDSLNLRCYDQKRRFGFDLLYPVQRYIDALSLPTVQDSHRCVDGDCPVVPNPLFVKDGQVRSPSRVLLTGIVGVPWQDLATEDSLAGGQLTYMTPEELEANGRWDVVLGDPANQVPPTDPLMIEQSNPRVGTNPVTGDALAPETSTDPTENPINGHEYVNVNNNDLQYSCIFPLATPRDCSPTSSNAACDCTEADLSSNRPLCNPPGGGAADVTQYYGKAYPGLRQLQVIRGLGSRAMPASICPKNSTGSPTDSDFGYNPAVDAIVKRVETGLGSSCVDELSADVSSSLSCRVLEVDQGGCDCTQPGRRAIPTDIEAVVDAELAGLCGQQGGDCSNYCACEVIPLTGSEQAECMTALTPASGDGWCYISPEQGIGSAELVEHCPQDSQRTVRVIGAVTQLAGSELRLLCL